MQNGWHCDHREEAPLSGKRTLYFDAYAGVAGDMTVGALLDLVTNGEAILREKLASVPLPGYELKIWRDTRGGISGNRVEVASDEHHPHRHLADILELIEKSALSPRVKEAGAQAFVFLAEAEAHVHATTPDQIHFHEVGAVDAIVDILGTMILMEALGWPQVVASALNVGSGSVRCDHGTLPVPAPATAELLRNVPIVSKGEPMERTTPTGAVLIKTLACAFGALPAGRIIGAGWGLGTKDTSDIPNALRVLSLELDAPLRVEPPRGSASEWLPSSEVCVLLEANLDDCNPQDLAYAVELLLSSGALDAWMEPIVMKKGRPATLLKCLGREEDAGKLAETILRHTTTLGVRFHSVSRVVLGRKIEERPTTLGPVHVKWALWEGKPIRFSVEYEDLKKISRDTGIPMPALRQYIQSEIVSAGAGDA